MFKIQWDYENNGIKLTNDILIKDSLYLLRPVFYEELDLLGFDKYWSYPKTKEPLLWSSGRRYFYCGVLVAEVIGGNLFDDPKIIIKEEGKRLKLKPVNLEKVINNNKESLFCLENEAIDFIEHTYKSKKNKVDLFVVSFSGGKDSQVILDLVSRVVPPDEYIIIFVDTQMEISDTYKTYENTKNIYTKLYPTLKFYKAMSEKNIEDLWQKFGPPSRIHRWCCSVMKLVPFLKKAIELNKNGKNNKIKILTFDGIRSDESIRRSGYERISNDGKHINQINAEIIKNWNTSEVFLYLFSRKIELNQAYRYGLNRVGCNICPFSSNWSEIILRKKYNSISSKFVKIIEDYVLLLGITDNNKVKEYIKEGQWKKRAGGEGVDLQETRIDFITEKPTLKVVIANPRENFFEWLKTIGNIIYKEKNNKIFGDIKFNKEIFGFEIEKINQKLIIIINNIIDPIFLSKIKKVIYKTTYCIHCGACEVKCQSHAISIDNEKIQIDSKQCSHCGNCLDISDKGCFLAKSVTIADNKGIKSMNNIFKGFGKYLTFGLKEEWLYEFLIKKENWFLTTTVGNTQMDSIIAWLRDAELIFPNNPSKKEKKITPLSEKLLYIYKSNPLLVWQIIWINFYFNSNVVKWYVDELSFNNYYSINEIKTIIQNSNDCSISERTIKSGISSLFMLFENSPYGRELKVGIIEKKGRNRCVIKKGTNDIDPIAIAYYLYKIAEKKERYYFTVSEFYEDVNKYDYDDLMNNCDKNTKKEGPYLLFGMTSDKFERILINLQETKNGIVKVDLQGGLDNIYLHKELSCEKILEYALKR